MKHTKSSLPLATKSDLESVQKAIDKCETITQVDDLKDWINTIQSLFKKRGLFERGFKASELWIEADRKFKELIGQSRLTNKDLAQALNMTTGTLKSIRHELKRAYDKPDEDIARLKHKAFEKREYLTRKFFINKGFIGASGDDEYYTPKEIIEAAREVMGGIIDLDPASNPIAQKTVQAKRYFTKDDDGLKQRWSGNVFLNPPFSNLDGFADKLMSEFKVISQAVFIGRMDVGTKWGQKLMDNSNAFCVPKRRIQFYGPDGISKGNNNMANIIFGLKVRPFQFEEAFKNIGVVTHRMFAPPLTKAEIQKAINAQAL